MIRIPTKSKFANEITPKDKRVKVYGTIVSINKEEGKFIIDDGSGSVGVFLNSLDLIEKLDTYKPKDQVVVIGWASQTGVGPASGVDCEIVRKITGFDPSRYKHVLEVCRHVSSNNERPEDSSGVD
ncbi:MAG: hypothetical protein GOU98_03705 [Candidatus Altiarchaeota archaeon]|nr:hypothetical protein [Candidatus Altiarchaeota archaeon]